MAPSSLPDRGLGRQETHVRDRRCDAVPNGFVALRRSSARGERRIALSRRRAV
jgi:hypothetical protein